MKKLPLRTLKRLFRNGPTHEIVAMAGEILELRLLHKSLQRQFALLVRARRKS